MHLIITSPCGYTQIYGINETIYDFCKAISKYVENKKYTEAIDSLEITPIVIPNSIIKDDMCKQESFYSYEHKYALISRSINYNKYHNGDEITKKKLIILNLFESVEKLSQIINFDVNNFKKDVLHVVDFSEKDLEKI